MTGAYKFAADLVKYIRKINDSEELKVNLKPFFFKIDKNLNPEIFEDPVVSILYYNLSYRSKYPLRTKMSEIKTY